MTKHEQCKTDILNWLRHESSGGSVSAADVAVKLLHRYSVNMCSKALNSLYKDGKLRRESKEKGILYYRLEGAVVVAPVNSDIDATLELARARNKALKQQLQATLAEQNDLLAAQKKTALSEIEAENQSLELEISQLEIENQRLRGKTA